MMEFEGCHSQTYTMDSANDKIMANSFVYRYIAGIMDDIKSKTSRQEAFTLSNTELDLMVFLVDQFARLLEFGHNNTTIHELLKLLVPQIIEPSKKEVMKSLPNTVMDGLSYVCYLCDEEIEITNNDIQYSLQLHLQSPSHLQTFEIFERIRECSSSKEGKYDDVEQKETAFDSVPEKSTSSGENVRNNDKRINDDQKNKKMVITKSVVGDGAVSKQNTKRTDPSTIASVAASISASAFSAKEESSSIHSEKRSLHQFYCSFCKISFLADEELANHLFTTHDQPEKPKLSSATPKYIYKKFNSNYCVLCLESVHSQLDIRMHVDSAVHKNRIAKVDGTDDRLNDTLITMKGDGTRHCVICDVSLPSQHNFDAHIFGKYHGSMLEITLARKSISKSTIEVSSTTSTISSKPTSSVNSVASGNKVTASIASSSTSDVRTKPLIVENSYNQEPFISTGKPSAEQFIRAVLNKYHCSLCNVYFPMGNGQIENHVRGQSHKTLLAMKSSAIQSPKGDAKPCLVNAHGGGKYCIICNVSLPKGSVYETHLNSRTHLWRLQQRDHERTPPVKGNDYINREITAEMMIGVENTLFGHFCTLCKIKLPGRSQLYQHTNSPGHKSQVEQHKRRNVEVKPIASNVAKSITVPAATKSVEEIPSVSSKRQGLVRSSVSSDTTYAQVTSKPLIDDKQTVIMSKRCDVCELDLSNEYEYGEHLKSSFHKLHAQLEETQVKMDKQNGQDLLERIDAASNFQTHIMQNQQYSPYVEIPLTRSQSQLLQHPDQFPMAPSFVPVAPTMSIPQIPPLMQTQYYPTSPSVVYPSPVSITHSQQAFSNPYVHPVIPSTIGIQQSFLQTQLSNLGGFRPTSTVTNNSMLNDNKSNLFNETIIRSAFNGAFNGNYEKPKTDRKLVNDRRLENGIIQKEDKSFYCMYCNTAIPFADGFEAHISTEIHFSSKEKSREDSCAIS